MNYGECLRMIRSYCIDKKLKNEILVNAPLEDFFERAKLKKEKGKNKGEPFRYDYSESSKIVNNNLEISSQIREALCKVGMEEIIENSVQLFYDDYVDKTSVADMIDEFIKNLDETGEVKKNELASLQSLSDKPGLFLGKIVVRSLKTTNEKRNEKAYHIWRKGTGSISVVKGDLFSYIFGRRSKKTRIVVIPVNTAFDTHVTTKAEKEPYPLVSQNTLHGELLYRLSVKGIKEEEVNKRIREDLKVKGVISGKEKKICLPIGTIAALEINNANVFLLAISEFDDKNNAHSSHKDLQTAVEKMVEYYDQKGQGYDIYIPLIGTGMSRAGFGHQESLDFIIQTLLDQREKIHGEVNIVIQPNVMKGLTIWEENKYDI